MNFNFPLQSLPSRLCVVLATGHGQTASHIKSTTAFVIFIAVPWRSWPSSSELSWFPSSSVALQQSWAITFLIQCMSGECGRGHSCVVIIAPRISVAFNFYPLTSCSLPFTTLYYTSIVPPRKGVESLYTVSGASQLQSQQKLQQTHHHTHHHRRQSFVSSWNSLHRVKANLGKYVLPT